MAEGSGQVFAEEGVGQKDQRKHGEVGHHAARALEGHQHAYAGHHIILRGEPAAAHGDVVIMKNEIAEGIEHRGHAYRIPQGGKRPVALFAAAGSSGGK